MNGTIFSATLPIDLIPPTITTNTSSATITPDIDASMPNSSRRPLAASWDCTALPVTMAENSVPKQNTTASQVHFGPSPIMM